MRRQKIWTDEEKTTVKQLAEQTKKSWVEIAEAVGANAEQARSLYRRLGGNDRRSYAFTGIDTSPYPKYDKPLEQEGDCLVIPDPEFPFHHADFLNRCIDLAQALGVRQACIAGDAVHFNSISHWEANWKAQVGSEISRDAYETILTEIKRLPDMHQWPLLDVLSTLAPTADGDVGSELAITRACFEALAQAFDDVVYVIGNHDGRLLSALNSPMFAGDLKRFVMGDNPKYRISEYYYSLLHTTAGTYRITHPVGSAQNTAVSLATQFHQHILMGHSHNYSRAYDPSGKYWAIQTGCCVDEARLAYCSQRDRGPKRHALGAVLVYGGYPYDLSDKTPWETLKKLANP